MGSPVVPWYILIQYPFERLIPSKFWGVILPVFEMNGEGTGASSPKATRRAWRPAKKIVEAVWTYRFSQRKQLGHAIKPLTSTVPWNVAQYLEQQYLISTYFH